LPNKIKEMFLSKPENSAENKYNTELINGKILENKKDNFKN